MGLFYFIKVSKLFYNYDYKEKIKTYKNMKKLLTLVILLMTTISFGQNISQWNFDNPTPATAMLPTTGTGTFTLIGGVVDNLNTSGSMPLGNGTETTNLGYSIKTFPATGTGNRTAGFQFAVSTLGFNEPINITFDPRGSNTSSRFQQYEYSIDGGTTWTIFGNNGGLLTNAFTATPMVTLELPSAASNKSGFVFRIVSIFNTSGSDYSPVGYASTPTPQTYGPGGTWRIDNFTVSNGALVLSINQNQILGLQVYPNPTKNVLNISTNSNLTKNVQVYDMIGKEVINTQIENQLNVSNLTPGMYVARITEEGKTSTTKLVIQ
jgi:hypothetical protein